ncbi:MAG: Yip1 family protein, partial [Hyphomonadaceae bacterium]
MAPDQEEKAQRRFSAEEARQRAQEARQKAEFILSRAYGLLREPKKEWAQIRGEETNIPSIMLGYVAPLAAIPPICGLIGAYIFGFSYAGVDIRPP